MLDFTVENLSSEDVERLRAVYEPLTQAVRELVDATIRTQADPATVAAVKAQIDSATALLRAKQLDGAFGVRSLVDGETMPWGNPVIGVRNPVAPPVVINADSSGTVWSDFRLGAAYEGPPGHVHGGVAALILDHVLGEAAAGGKHPSFTGAISLRYVRATPLGDLHVEAAITRIDGVKTFAAGHIADDEGITVQAEGVFIKPRWAREQPEAH